MSDLPARLAAVSVELRKIALEYWELRFTAEEEAMLWPLSVVVEDDGEIGLWCNKEGCLLDCENSRINIDLKNFTVADLLGRLTGHIEHNREKAAS